MKKKIGYIMGKYTLESQEAIIVLVGAFNPAIFHPEWLLRHNLISPDDSESAEIEIVHNDISQFNFDWLKVAVQRNRFSIRTNDPSKFSPLRDLAVSIFSILDSTPIRQMGLNMSIRYKIDSENDWHKIGDTLAPKEIWRQSIPDRVGLTSLTVQSPREDEYKGHINITVGPKDITERDVVFAINNHIEIPADDDHSPVQLITELWEKYLESSKAIAETTISEILK